MEHVQDTIYAELICPGANVDIIATAKGALVVDTPLLGRQAEAIDRALPDAGHQPLRFILISHPHGDHILGTDLFGQKVLIIGIGYGYLLDAKIELDPAAVSPLRLEAGCFVLVCNLSCKQDRNQWSAKTLLELYKDQGGIEQNF